MKWWITLVAAFSLTACAGMTIRSDYDPQAAPSFPAYRTYSWLPQPDGRDTRVYNPIVEGRIVGAVDRELAGRGYQKASDNPDFRIGWHAAIESKTDVDVVNRYYGYGLSRWGTGVVVQDTYVREYDQGTLILDIVDGGSNQLVWRGSAQAEIRPTDDPAKRQERISNAVRLILERFPPQE